MPFIEQRLLDCVSYGTQGGPTWSTRKVGLKSGIVRRNATRSRPLYRFTVLYNNLSAEHHEDVIDAFNACRGGLYSFRLKDWSDFVATSELFPVTGTGSPQTLQLSKNYTFSTETVARPIHKPVAGTVVVTANGTPISASVDYTTGMATFTATNGHVLRWSGEFDVPVMFANDELLFDANSRNNDGLVLTADVDLIEDLSA